MFTISGTVQAPADPAVLWSHLFGKLHTYENLKYALESFVLDSVLQTPLKWALIFQVTVHRGNDCISFSFF